MTSGVPMRFPISFRRLVRKKSADKDLSMYKYLERISKDDDGGERNKSFFNFKF